MSKHITCANCHEPVVPESTTVEQTDPEGIVHRAVIWACPRCEAIVEFS